MIYWLQCVMVSRPEILLLFVVGRLQGKSYHYANLPGQRLLYYMCTSCTTYPHQRSLRPLQIATKKEEHSNNIHWLAWLLFLSSRSFP